MAQFQKNLLGIAEELDQIRLTSPKDIHLLSTNIGRIQGMANGLDWYLAHVGAASKELKPAMGFNIVGTMSPEEEELPLEEEDSKAQKNTL